MCDTVFAFGQRGGYFFESPSRRISHGLPPGLAALFARDEVAETYCLALGQGESYAISYNGKDNMLHIQTSGLPQGLRDWLMQKDTSGTLARKLEKLKISLGPYNESYFATDGISSRWLNLPPALDTALEQRRKPGGGWTAAPRLVALGAMRNYIYLTDGNGRSSILSNYRQLDGIVDIIAEKDGGFGLIHNLVLDPYRQDAFVLQSTNGIVMDSHTIPQARAGLDTITKAIQEDTETAIRRKIEANNAAEQARLYTAQLQQQVAQLRAAQEMQAARNMRAAQQMNAYANMVNSINMLTLASMTSMNFSF